MRLHNHHLALARYQSTLLLSVASVQLVADNAERAASARIVPHAARVANAGLAELARVALVATAEIDENQFAAELALLPFAAAHAALAATDESKETC